MSLSLGSKVVLNLLEELLCALDEPKEELVRVFVLCPEHVFDHVRGPLFRVDRVCQASAASSGLSVSRLISQFV